MSKESSQPLDFLAQEFVDSRRDPKLASSIPETDGSVRTFIESSDDPKQTAGEILQKILLLIDPSNAAETRITLDATRVVMTAVANVLVGTTKQSTTIESDPETGKPVIPRGFNPRKKFG